MRIGAIVSVLPAVLLDRAREEAVRKVSYSHLMYIGENTAKAVSRGRYLPVEYNDIINPKPKDTRTADEIATDVVNKVGIKVE